MNKRLAKSLFLIILSFLLLSACVPATPTELPPTATEAPLAAATNTALPPQPTNTLQIYDIKVGIVPYSSYLPFYIAQEEGYFVEQGLNVELVKFTKQSDAIPVLAQGQIDAYAGQMDTMTLNAIVQGAAIKIVADKGYNNPNGCVYSAWVAQKSLVENGTLDDLQNLAGLKIAYPKAQSPEYVLDMMLESVGLTSADVQIIDVPAPTRVTSLENGGADIIFVSEPYITQAINTGKGVIWKAWETYLPDYQIGLLLYGDTLLKNTDAGQRFMVAYLKAVRQYMEGQTDRNVQLMSEFMNITPEVAKQSCWQSIRTNGAIHIESVLDFQDWAIEKGYQISALKAEDFWDSSFVDYANGVLK